MEIINDLLVNDQETFRSAWLLLIGLFGLAAFGALLWWLLGDRVLGDECDRLELKERYDFAPVDADDLTRIDGIDPVASSKLNKLGIYKFEQLADLNERQQQQLSNEVGVSSAALSSDIVLGESSDRRAFDQNSINWDSWEDRTSKQGQSAESNQISNGGDGFEFDGADLKSNIQGKATDQGYQFGVDHEVRSNLTQAENQEAHHSQASNGQVPEEGQIRDRAISLSNWRSEREIEASPEADWILAERELFIESCGNSISIDRDHYYQDQPKDEKIVDFDIETRNEFNRLGYLDAESIVGIQSEDRERLEHWFQARQIPLDLDQLQTDLIDDIEGWPRVPTETEIGIRASELSDWRKRRGIEACEQDDWLLAERELYISACGLPINVNRSAWYKNGLAKETMPEVSDEIANELGRLGFPTVESLATIGKNERRRIEKWFKARNLYIDFDQLRAI